MAADEHTGAPVRFCTDDLPERDRLPILRELIGRTISHLDLEPVGDGPFRSESVSRTFPDLALAAMSVEGIRSRRTRELLSDGNDDILLLLMDQGAGFFAQLGREVVTDASTAVLLSNADVSAVTTPIAKGYSLRIPRRAVLPLASKLEDAFLRPLPRSNNLLRLLTGYIATIERMPPPITLELRHLMATHVHDLIALIVGATGDVAKLALGRGARAARLAAIKTDMIEHLETRELTIAWLAQRHRLSERSIQMLFEAEQTTFSEFLLERRLERLHRALGDRRFAGHSISALVYEFGFGDLSYFNRTFRRRYGMTPSERRAQATAETQG